MKKQMRILVADKLSDSCVKLFEDAGHSVLMDPSLKGDSLVERIAGYAPVVLIVRSTKVPAEAIMASKGLELIVRAGAGYDNIDVATSSAEGVFVANCPGKNADAVAELAMGLLLSLDRRIPDNVIDARQGVWNKTGYARARGVKGRTLGVIGLGNIGRAVVRRAQSFDMNVIAWSRSLDDATAAALGVERCNSAVEVASRSDAVSLHVASAPETAGLAGTDFFDAMRPGAYFINTTRAGVVDEHALCAAIETKGIRAALDVFSDEPAYKEGAFEHRLASEESIYLTHHIGASTAQAQEAIAVEAARVVLEYHSTGDVSNCVNMAVHSGATLQITVRHRDKVGVLASVLDSIRRANWNVQEMENRVFEGGQAACAYIRYTGDRKEAVIEEIRSHPDVLAATVVSI